MANRLQQFLMISLLLGGHSMIALAAEQDSFDRTHTNQIRFTKEEIAAAAKPTFIATSDFGTLLRDKVVLIATTLTSRQGGSNRALFDTAATYNQISKETLLKRLSVIHYEQPETLKTDSDKIRGILLGQTRKSGEVKFKEAFPIIERVQKGSNFRWTPGKSSNSAGSAPQTPDIKYGLIVEDIHPQKSPPIASLEPMNDSYWQYARPAKVIYTIDKLGQDSSNAQVFTLTETSNQITPTITSESRSWKSKFVERFKAPSTDLDIKIEAANSEDTVSDKVGAGSLPGGKVTISQIEGLFSIQATTTARLGKDSLYYENKLPLIGEACITRKWDDKFRPMQTSLLNLLVTEKAPKLNIHQNHVEKKLKGELLFKKQGFDFALAVEPRIGWDYDSNLGQAGDKISLTIQNSF